MLEAATEVFCKKRSSKFRKFHREAPVLESPFNRVAGPLVCCVNIVVFWLLLSVFITTKQIFVISLFSYHRLKVLKNRSHVFSSFLDFYNLFVHFLVKRFFIRQYHLMLFLNMYNKTFFPREQI